MPYWLHGHAANGRMSPTYSTWAAMIKRCTNKRCSEWPRYGGRGIRVCDRWLRFGLFLEDMGYRPADMCLDRVDNDGDYDKENCRWASYKEQANNRSSNTVIEWHGVRLNLKQWSERLDIKYETLVDRVVRRGWDVDRAFTTPRRAYSFL